MFMFPTMAENAKDYWSTGLISSATCKAISLVFWRSEKEWLIFLAKYIINYPFQPSTSMSDPFQQNTSLTIFLSTTVLSGFTFCFRDSLCDLIHQPGLETLSVSPPSLVTLHVTWQFFPLDGWLSPLWPPAELLSSRFCPSIHADSLQVQCASPVMKK